VQPANTLYKYKWEWSLDGLFTDTYPGQPLGQGNEDEPFLITEQPIQDPCATYFIKLTITLNDVIVATEVISKKGDICTDNVQDCNTFNYVQNQVQSNIFKSEGKNQSLSADISKLEKFYLLDIYGRLILSNTSLLMIENKLHQLLTGIYFISTKSEKIFNHIIK